MSSIFCFKIFFSKSKNASWDFLPDEAKKHIVEYLTPKEKAKLAITSKDNYDLVKSVPTYIRTLQFCPIRHNAQCAEIFVFFDEEHRNSQTFYFDKQGITSYMKSTKTENGIEAVGAKQELKTEFREMADLCFQGWVTGAEVHTLDIRGDYRGKLPERLNNLINFSFNDKYNRSVSAIPAWLDVIQMGEIHFMLMSDHWDQILGHRHFSNPQTTCTLTGYDGVGHESLCQLNCKRIRLNNIKDEKSFNVLVKKWTTGEFADTFETLIVTSTTRPLSTERLLEEIKVQSLEASQFEKSEIAIQTNDKGEYFLVFGPNGKYGVFCGVDDYARFSVINQQLVDEVPQLSNYHTRVWRPLEQ